MNNKGKCRAIVGHYSWGSKRNPHSAGGSVVRGLSIHNLWEIIYLKGKGGEEWLMDGNIQSLPIVDC